MKTVHIQSLLMAIMLFIGLPLSAQKLTVESMRLLSDDATARDEKYQRVDGNGNLAGLVKVQVALDDVKFDGGMLLDQKKWSASEYWVWMADGATKLTVVAPGFLPLEINFRDFDFKMLHSKNTYKLVVTVPTEYIQIIQDFRETTDLSSSSDGTIQSFTVKGVTFNMVRIDGGTFQMGATSEQGRDAQDSEKPVHNVTLDDFMIGQTEVTQALWEAVMGNNPSKFKGAKNPVQMVSWEDCKVFISKLDSLTGQDFRLPTEAEWEFAARGGNKSGHFKYSGSNKIKDVAWFDGKEGSGSHPVATKQKNELNLYDMSGNVYEWCEDWYDSYSDSFQTNPQGAEKGTFRVNRGGGWYNYDINCRVSHRGFNTPSHRSYDLGFRLAL